MDDFKESKYYVRWQATHSLEFFKYALLANIMHIFLLFLGYKRLMYLLKKLVIRKKITHQYQLTKFQDIKSLKKKIRPIFIRIRDSKWLWSNCLSSSILLWYVLQKQGLFTTLIIGTKFQKGQFKAHAWIEYNEFPLNEHKRVRENYQAFEYNFINIL